MSTVKPDKIVYTNLIEAFTNYSTPSNTITISGSIANGASANFSCTVLLSRSKTLADVYATNQNTGKKMSLLAGSVHNPYQSVSSEVRAHSITYTASTNSVLVNLLIINNSGAGIVLTTQVWDITPVLYDVPYLS